jgi:putative phosphoesterase
LRQRYLKARRRYMKITLLSDSHSYMDEQVLKLCAGSDEIWHAGDIGSPRVCDQLAKVAKVRAVFGNIDDPSLRREWPEELAFEIENYKVWMTHIGGYPGRYHRGIKEKLREFKPDLYICGHSHILKVMPDKDLGLLHMNPGAIGKQGLHQIRTLLRFKIENGKLSDLEVVELERWPKN